MTLDDPETTIERLYHEMYGGIAEKKTNLGLKPPPSSAP